MLICPRCRSHLKKSVSNKKFFWACPTCNGRVASLEVLHKIVPQSIMKEIWRRSLSGSEDSSAQCPVCTCVMTDIPLQFGGETGYLDVCKRCRFIWFDSYEYEDLQTKSHDTPAKPLELPSAAKEALAIEHLKALREERHQKEIGASTPDNCWELVLGFFGMPVEYNNTGLRYSPFVTWTIAATILFVTVASFSNLETAVNDWGLIPSNLTRHYGLTFISSFFLHGGVFHLIGHLYFLLIFGDNVEDVLGKPWYLLLLTASTLAGDFAHIMIDSTSAIPLIGASGGISGIMAYYCLRFPKARVGLLMWFRWFRIPVGWLLGIWVLSQIFGVMKQMSGFENVSAAAHLGGAGIGLLFWWATNPKRTGNESDAIGM